MKILHIITGLSTGGAETMLYKLVKESNNRPEEHVVVSMMDEGTRGDGIKLYATLYCLNLKQGRFSFKAFWNLIKIIKKEQPDIIQGWMYHANLIASLANVFCRKVLFWNVRQSLTNLDNEKTLTKIVINLSKIISRYSPNRIVYNSYTSLNQHKAIGFESDKSFVLVNGFDLTIFSAASENDKLQVREKLGIPHGSLVFGHVARFHPMKNHIGFVEAISSLMEIYPHIYVVMVGLGVNKENHELMRVINEKANHDRFILEGERNDLHKIFHSFDFLVSPSLWGEAFPNVIGEAMACGIPCVVSDVGDSAQIVGETGFIFNPNDPLLLRNSLNDAISLDSVQYANRSEAVRLRVEALYSISSVYSQYIAAYKDVVISR